MIKRSLLSIFLTATASMSVTSCVDNEVTLFVNSDGSGKIIAVIPEPQQEPKSDAFTQYMVNQLLRETGLPPETSLGTIGAAEFISKTTGLDCWTDVMKAKSSDGRDAIVLRGYFRDLAKVKIHRFQPPGTPPGSEELGTLSAKSTATGGLVIAVRRWKEILTILSENPDSVKAEIEALKNKSSSDSQKIAGVLLGALFKNGTKPKTDRFKRLNAMLTINTAGKITKHNAFTVNQEQQAQLKLNSETPGLITEGENIKPEPWLIVVEKGPPLFDYESEKAAAIKSRSPRLTELEKIGQALNGWKSRLSSREPPSN